MSAALASKRKLSSEGLRKAQRQPCTSALTSGNIIMGSLKSLELLPEYSSAVVMSLGLSCPALKS